METITKNLNFIQQYIPDLYNELTEKENQNSPETELYRQMDELFFLNGDVKKICPTEVKGYDTNELNIVVGVGNNVEFISAYDISKKTNLVIVEPNADIFYAWIEKFDLQELAIFNNVVFLVNKPYEEVKEIVLNLLKQNKLSYQFHINDDYRIIYKQYVHFFVEGTRNYVDEMIMNLNTHNRAKEAWLMNQLINSRIKSAYSFDEMKSYFKGKEVVVVGAGPSLRDRFEEIEALKKHAIVIACGTAIRIFDENGVKPHFRAAIDQLNTEAELFKNLSDKSVPVIYASSIHGEALESYEGPKIKFQLSNSYVDMYVEKINGVTRSQYDTFSSVTIVMMNLVANAGCKEVVMIGQDLALKNNRRYAHDDSHKDELLDEEYYTIENNLGEEVLTTKQYLNYRVQIEKLIAKYNRTSWINLSSSGAKIQGSTFKDLSEYLSSRLNDQLVQEFKFEDIGVIPTQGLQALYANILSDVLELDGKIASIPDINMLDIYLDDSPFYKEVIEKFISELLIFNKNFVAEDTNQHLTYKKELTVQMLKYTKIVVTKLLELEEGEHV